MSIEAMKQALELAREGVEIHNENSPEYKVCAALLAITKMVEQEPVGFYDAENKDLRQEIPMGEDGDWWQPVYTHPQPKREPVALRGEQFVDMARAIAPRTVMGMKEQIPNWIVEFGRAIEAAHGIKENT